MKELYSSGTFIGHVEWPAALDQSGKFQLTAIPKEVQDDLAALFKRQMEKIDADAEREDVTLGRVGHVVTFAEESPDSSVVEAGVYLVLETHVTVNKESSC